MKSSLAGRFCLLVCAILCIAVLPALRGAAAEKNEWVDISEPVTSQLVKDGKKIGYPGLTAGVAVDPSTGEVFMVVCDQGLWKSADKGASFTRVDGGKIGGRCETGYALIPDPAGKRMACFMIYGACASTEDAGKSWTGWKTNHLDFGAVDWDDTGKAFLGFRHESGGVLCLSTDGGASWANLGRAGEDKKIVKEDRDYKGLGMFDAKTLMATRGDGFLRSVDGGASWKPATFEGGLEKVKPAAPIMLLRKGVGYWCTDKGILVSRTKGETWTRLSEIKAVFGPYFGKDDSHMVVVTKEGFQESKDGGKTWKMAAPLPKGFNVGLVGPNYAWDPVNDLFYASAMGKATYRFTR